MQKPITKNLLAKKAVLSTLTISQWSARRLDKRITDEVNETHHAVSDAGRYNKLLINKSALEPIWKITSAARGYHAMVTQPWLDTGTRLLPAKLFEEHTARTNAWRNEFERAADEFADAYPEHVAKRKAELNGMFNDDDYPHWKKVRSLFSFDVITLPCPDAGDFRVDLARGHADDIKRQVEKRMQQALDDAMKEPVRRIIEVVGHMSARLKTYTLADQRPSVEGEKKSRAGYFRDSLVENVRELADLLPAFNLTDHPGLTQIIERIKHELCVEDAKVLREHSLVREAVASSADDILDKAKAFLA